MDYQCAYDPGIADRITIDLYQLQNKKIFVRFYRGDKKEAAECDHRAVPFYNGYPDHFRYAGARGNRCDCSRVVFCAERDLDWSCRNKFHGAPLIFAADIRATRMASIRRVEKQDAKFLC